MSYRAPGGFRIGLGVSVALAALLACSGRSLAFTLFGEPPTLSSGNAYSLPFTLLGEQVTPRLDVDGFVRWTIEDIQQNNMRQDVVSPELDLETNLQLTATQRIHMLFQPLDGGFQQPWLYHIHPGGGWTINENRSSGRPAAVWYEGEPFNWLSPRDQEPLDINLAVGRMPIFFQNGILLNNIADAVMIGKNSIQLGNLSNLNVIGFATLHSTQGGTDPQDKAQQQKRLVGFDSDMDLLEYFVEVSYARAYDNTPFRGIFGPKGEPLPGEQPQDLDRGFWAISATRTFGRSGISLRALGSTSNRTASDGELYVFEGNTELAGQHLYLNLFGSDGKWLTASNQYSAPLANEGILWAPDRLLPTIGMKLSGQRVVGGVAGVILNPRGHLTVTPEFDYSIDTNDPGNDQVGIALQSQADLSSFLIPGNSLDTLAQRGLLYGLIARITLGGIRNQNTVLAKDRFDLLEKLELIYEF